MSDFEDTCLAIVYNGGVTASSDDGKDATGATVANKARNSGPKKKSPQEAGSFAGILRLAFLIGTTAFGGGFAIIARLKQAVVDDRGWLNETDFMEHVAVASVLPGTNATNLIVLLGSRFGGVLGAVLSGFVYVLPSAVAVIAVASKYDVLRRIAAIATFFDGLAAAVVGLVLWIAIDLARATLKQTAHAIIAVVALVLMTTHWLGLLWVILLAACAGIILSRTKLAMRGAPLFALAPLAKVAVFPASLAILFVFGKIGVATFGGGFAMIPTMRTEALAHGWLTGDEFADAIAIGQITPGPVAISATFIGYRVAGWLGAFAATVGIFGPPALLAIFAARSFERVRTSPLIRGMMFGITPAVVGIIAAASYHLWESTHRTWAAAAIALSALLLRLWRPRWSVLLPLALGGVAAIGLSRFG